MEILLILVSSTIIIIVIIKINIIENRKKIEIFSNSFQSMMMLYMFKATILMLKFKLKLFYILYSQCWRRFNLWILYSKNENIQIHMRKWQFIFTHSLNEFSPVRRRYVRGKKNSCRLSENLSLKTQLKSHYSFVSFFFVHFILFHSSSKYLNERNNIFFIKKSHKRGNLHHKVQCFFFIKKIVEKYKYKFYCLLLLFIFCSFILIWKLFDATLVAIWTFTIKYQKLWCWKKIFFIIFIHSQIYTRHNNNKSNEM